MIPLPSPHYEYTDLVDALRRNRVRQSYGPNTPDAPLEAYQLRRDWTVPTYDFGTMIEHIAVKRYDVAERLIQCAAELARDSLLRAPYEECVFILRHIPDWRVPLGGAAFWRVEHNGSEVVADGFMRLGGSPVFTRSPLKLHFVNSRSDPSIRLHSDFDLSVREEWSKGYNREPTDDEVVWDAANAIAMALAILCSRHRGDIFSFTAPETDKLKSMNAGRALARKPLKAIPATTLLKIDLDAVARISWTGRPGSHSPKSPHNRAGHWRTVKGHSRPVWVSPAKIKGGSESRSYIIAAK